MKEQLSQTWKSEPKSGGPFCFPKENPTELLPRGPFARTRSGGAVLLALQRLEAPEHRQAGASRPQNSGDVGDLGIGGGGGGWGGEGEGFVITDAGDAMVAHCWLKLVMLHDLVTNKLGGHTNTESTRMMR